MLVDCSCAGTPQAKVTVAQTKDPTSSSESVILVFLEFLEFQYAESRLCVRLTVRWCNTYSVDPTELL